MMCSFSSGVAEKEAAFSAPPEGARSSEDSAQTAKPPSAGVLKDICFLCAASAHKHSNVMQEG